MIHQFCPVIRERLRGEGSNGNEERKSDEEKVGNGNEDSDNEEARNGDEERDDKEIRKILVEVTDAGVIGGGPEEERERVVEEAFERSGMVRYEILEYTEENCKCCFCCFSCLSQLYAIIITHYFNIRFYKYKLHFRYIED